MEEEVKKWVKKRLQETSASRAEEIKDATSKEISVPAETQSPQDERKISAEGMWEKTEEEKPHDSSQEPPHSDVEKATEVPQIKENLNIDTDFSKVQEQERPQPLPEKKSKFSTRTKVLMMLIAALLGFLAYWFYTTFSIKIF